MSNTSVSKLPFPMVSLHPEQCIACGYDLSGVKNRCPECGARTDGEPGALLIAGVPRVEDSNPWRRLAFIVLAIAIFALSQGLFLLGNLFGFITMAWIFVVVVASTIAIIVTSPTKKRSVERIAFTRAGFGRAAWGGEYDKRFIPWTGTERISVKRIATVWQKLVIHATDERNKSKRIFETGFRCKYDEIGWVRDAITAMSMDGDIPERPNGHVHQQEAHEHVAVPATDSSE